MIIDTHTHLYLKDFDADINAVVKRALDSNINNFFLPAIDSSQINTFFIL